VHHPRLQLVGSRDPLHRDAHALRDAHGAEHVRPAARLLLAIDVFHLLGHRDSVHGARDASELPAPAGVLLAVALGRTRRSSGKPLRTVR
jgi:hypothetical protein